MELWRTSAVNQRAQKGVFLRTSASIKICNEISDLRMAEQVVFETTIWVSNTDSGNGRNQPFFGRERYARDAAVSVPPADKQDGHTEPFQWNATVRQSEHPTGPCCYAVI